MNQLDGYVRLFRLERAFSAVSGVLITGLLVNGFREITFVHGYAALSVFFSALANFVLNDIHDLESDKVNKRPDRPIALGLISKENALGWAIASGVLAIGFASILPSAPKTMILIGLPFTLGYNVFLKRFLLFKNLFTGLANSGIVLVSASITGMHIDPFVLFLTVFGFFFSLSYEIMLDIADVEGDNQNGVETIPVRFGVEKAVLISTFFGVITILMSPVPFFIDLDSRLLSNPVFLLIALGSIIDRSNILLGLQRDQSPETVLKLKTRLFRNLQVSGLGYLVGILFA